MNNTFIKVACVFAFLFAGYHHTQAQLYINEFLASNATDITDEAGENEDWIEVYNAGSTAVDLGGYYISDDAIEPLLWQIPTTDPGATTVPAGGYLILWADKDLTSGANHLDIRLGSGGEDIILTEPDGITVVDQLTFGAQTADVSYGRETDGSPNFVFMPTTTPGAANVTGGGGGGNTITVNVSVPITAFNDDAEEFAGGGVTATSSDIELGADGALPITSGLRFDNVPLPAGSTVSSAYIQFYAEETNASPANLNIVAHDVADAPAFQTASFNITSRPATSASVNWLPASWPTIDENGTAQQTPDLTALVEEVIANSGWAEGNAIAFIISGTGTRTTYSYDLNPSRVANLVIEAEVPLPNNSIPTVYINELAANASTFADASGKFEDWVEIYNPNAQDVDLGGLFLTDDYGNLDKWPIPSGSIVPAGGYLLFFTDNDESEGPLHTNFSLKAGGEEVALVQLLSGGPEIIDSVSWEDMPFQATYGRSTDGTGGFVFLGETTPEASNNGAGLYLSPPDFSVPSGSYTSTQSVAITHPDGGVNIYYSTDGMLPNTSSTFYTGPVSVSSTQSLRAIAVKAGHANSHASDATYLVNESHNIPIIYITTDPDNFWDDEIGIYTDGTNGIPHTCGNTGPVNWAQPWERPANFKMFLPDGTLAFDVDGGTEISGTCSRLNAMKSLDVNLRDKNFGDEAIEYPLYPYRNHLNYKRLKLRNSGQDYVRLGFRDMLNQKMLFGKLDLELQAGFPTLVYLNGEFFGLYNLREKFSGEYFEAIYDVKEEDLDILKSPGIPWTEVKEGSTTIYDALFNVVTNSNMTNNSDWAYFESQVDVNEMMNYWIVMTYMANYDWPANNLRVWRERKTGAKWRYCVNDTDGSTNNFLSDWAKPDYNTFASINDPNSSVWPNHSGSTLFLRKSLERQEFRDEFIQRTCSVIDLVYSVDRTNQFIDEMVALFQPNVQRQLNKWGYDNAMGGSEFAWNEWIQKFRDFWAQRPAFFRQHVNDFYGLDGTYQLTFNYDQNTGGDIFVNTNGMEIPYDHVGTYFKDIPLRVKLVEKPGFSFLYWLETGETSKEIDFVANGNATLTPIFDTGGCAGQPCNDGDACTVNDVFDQNCNCVGIFQDSDGDGVCDADDQCPGFDDNIDQNNNGIPDGCDTPCTDNDNDGVCQPDDCNDNDASIPTTPGTPCDDGNILTNNDVILADGCTCQGSVDPPGQYCDAIGQTPWLEWIAGVELNDLNNTSGKNQYGNFTGQTVTLDAGSSYPITLSAGYSYFTYNEYFRVWIDYNQNGVFEEPGEIAYSDILSGVPNGVSPAPISGTVNVPASALQGATRMRVSMQRDGYAPPCGNFQNGEVEDYGVVINAGTGSTLTITSCPANISVTAPQGQTSATVSWNDPTASTTCPTPDIDISQTSGPPSGSSFNVGPPTPISYSLSDQCGNSASCSFDVTVNPASNGEITINNCPSNLFLTAQPGQSGASVVWAEPFGSTTCPNGGFSLNQVNGPSNGSFFPIGTTVVSYLATDVCGNSETCSFDVTVEPNNNGGDYCESRGDFPWEDWIAGVEFNTISNFSGKSQYSDYTGLVSPIDNAASYTITLVAGFSYFSYEEHWKVWIDYDQSGTFDEPAEVAFYGIMPPVGNGTPTATLNGNITVPANASPGVTRMRVAMKQGSEPGPCEAFPFGEVEDYNVIVADNGQNPSPNVNLVANSDIQDIDLTGFVGKGKIGTYWRLEKSSDNINFDLLLDGGFDENKDYALIHSVDGDPLEGFNYYRLRLYDEDSNLISESRSIASFVPAPHFGLFPNPSNGEFNIEMSELLGMDLSIRIHDQLGHLVFEKSITDLDMPILRILVDGWRDGLYNVSVKPEGRKMHNKRLVLTR